MQKLFDSAEGWAVLMATLRPVINASVLHHISQPFYSETNALYFMKSQPLSHPTSTSKIPPQAPISSHTKSSTSSPKVIEDLPAGLPLENINLPPDQLQRHPLLPLLFDTGYVQRVILTVRERLHM